MADGVVVHLLLQPSALYACSSASRNSRTHAVMGSVSYRVVRRTTLRERSPWKKRSYSTCREANALQQVSQARRKSRTRSAADAVRSEEHTSELQSQSNLVCRLLLEKKKKKELSQRLQHTTRQITN